MRLCTWWGQARQETRIGDEMLHTHALVAHGPWRSSSSSRSLVRPVPRPTLVILHHSQAVARIIV